MQYEMTDYTSDSDISEDTRELVKQGLASVMRKRIVVTPRVGRLREQVSVHNMDISSVRSQLRRKSVNGDTSTHGNVTYDRELSNAQNHNSGTAEVGLEGVAEPRNTRTELSR